MNPYEILGASSDADIETLRVLYRRLVRVHHPDRACDAVARAAANERMMAINHAWYIVGDPQRRAAYDARIRWQQLDEAREKSRQQPPIQTAPLDAQTLERERLERERLEQKLRRPQRSAPPATKAQAREELDQLLRQRLQGKIKVSSDAEGRRQLREAMRLFWEQDLPGEAIALCNQVLSVDNGSVPARELLGDFYLQLGRRDRALPLWEQALLLQPDNASIRRKLRALRPHDARSYPPQPRIPGRNRAVSDQLAMRARVPVTLSFWGRLRRRLRVYLRGW